MFLLKPVYRDYLWGGTRLRTMFDKADAPERLAESWELSAHPDGACRIASGEHLNESFAEYWQTHFQEPFPILCKLIDAEQSLSVQVHPDDAYAAPFQDNGKTELWHILEAEPEAYLYLGVRETTDPKELRERIQDGTVETLLRKVPVKKGETYFIPAGTLHAIGKGIVLFEVQQSSNLTYRVYDFGRLGADGKPRELHIAHALQVADLQPFDGTPPNGTATQSDANGTERWLCRCPYFTLSEQTVHGRRSVAAMSNDFLWLLVTEGKLKAVQGSTELSLNKGNSLFLPAAETAVLAGEARVLCVSKGSLRN